MHRSRPAPRRVAQSPNSPVKNKMYTIAILSFFAIFLILIFSGFMFMVSTFSTSYTPATIGSLDSAKRTYFKFPTQNDTLIKGQTYTLLFDGGPPTIESMTLVQKGLSDQAIRVPIADQAYSIENTGEFEFTVPTNIPDGQYTIEAGPLVSELFTISSK